MTIFTIAKFIHIWAAIVMIGLSIANGFIKLSADRTGNVPHIAWATALVMRINWRLILPSIIALPLSGYGLTRSAQLSFSAPWLTTAVWLTAMVCLAFPLALWLEGTLASMAAAANSRGDSELPSRYWTLSRYGVWFGSAVGVVVLVIVLLMVAKYQLVG